MGATSTKDVGRSAEPGQAAKRVGADRRHYRRLAGGAAVSRARGGAGRRRGKRTERASVAAAVGTLRPLTGHSVGGVQNDLEKPVVVRPATRCLPLIAPLLT